MVEWHFVLSSETGYNEISNCSPDTDPSLALKSLNKQYKSIEWSRDDFTGRLDISIFGYTTSIVLHILIGGITNQKDETRMIDDCLLENVLSDAIEKITEQANGLQHLSKIVNLRIFHLEGFDSGCIQNLLKSMLSEPTAITCIPVSDLVDQRILSISALLSSHHNL